LGRRRRAFLLKTLLHLTIAEQPKALSDGTCNLKNLKRKLAGRKSLVIAMGERHAAAMACHTDACLDVFLNIVRRCFLSTETEPEALISAALAHSILQRAHSRSE
jgi:hypothetical protein